MYLLRKKEFATAIVTTLIEESHTTNIHTERRIHSHSHKYHNGEKKIDGQSERDRAKKKLLRICVYVWFSKIALDQIKIPNWFWWTTYDQIIRNFLSQQPSIQFCPNSCCSNTRKITTLTTTAKKINLREENVFVTKKKRKEWNTHTSNKYKKNTVCKIRALWSVLFGYLTKTEKRRKNNNK